MRFGERAMAGAPAAWPTVEAPPENGVARYSSAPCGSQGIIRLNSGRSRGTAGKQARSAVSYDLRAMFVNILSLVGEVARNSGFRRLLPEASVLYGNLPTKKLYSGEDVIMRKVKAFCSR